MNFLWISIISCVLLQKSVFSQESAEHGPGLKPLRGGPKGPMGRPHLIKCCKIQNSTEQTELMQTIKGYMDECHQQIDGTESEEPGKFACIGQCVAKKLSIIDESDNFNAEGFQNFVTNQMATEDFQKAIASDVATKCIEKVQNATSETPESVEANKNGCHNVAKKAVWCVAKEFLIACPTELQNPSERCEQIRENVKNGGSKSAGGPRSFAGYEDI